ncbi:uncharacterized protein BDZ99DRAFT_574957 [Mytilinidion resinicola]|uniref:Uncharacterized protein n=1 Tax=Mytilinidion resinicola TaxID=574789 RepID=A0A6A6YC20_9PEZI|nr:uncharacterized protein BDZ99DRAFT_574957 [Mytilinidion resinicola]KAF2805387.1 hypothetical protein BDZ99DRAFT_574957 [Mytilinidion resinicola]
MSTQASLRFFTPLLHTYLFPLISWLATGVMNIIPQARDVSLATVPLLIFVAILIVFIQQPNRVQTWKDLDHSQIFRYSVLFTLCRMAEETAVVFTRDVLQPPRGLFLTFILAFQGVFAERIWDHWMETPETETSGLSALWSYSNILLPWSLLLPQLPTLLLCSLFLSNNYIHAPPSLWSLMWRLPLLNILLFPPFYITFLLLCQKWEVARHDASSTPTPALLLLRTKLKLLPHILPARLLNPLLPWPVDAPGPPTPDTPAPPQQLASRNATPRDDPVTAQRQRSRPSTTAPGRPPTPFENTPFLNRPSFSSRFAAPITASAEDEVARRRKLREE